MSSESLSSYDNQITIHVKEFRNNILKKQSCIFGRTTFDNTNFEKIIIDTSQKTDKITVLENELGRLTGGSVRLPA